jgi:hypothetical protein
MAGKLESESEDNKLFEQLNGKPSLNVEYDELNKQELPVTVMVSKSDGEFFSKEVQSEVSNERQQFKINVKSQNGLFDSFIFGSYQYPKVFASSAVIVVLSTSNWGGILKANNEDWQLYLLSKEDTFMSRNTLVPPYVVTSFFGQEVYIPNSVFVNPAEFYRHSLLQKCPSATKLGLKIL